MTARSRDAPRCNFLPVWACIIRVVLRRCSLSPLSLFNHVSPFFILPLTSHSTSESDLRVPSQGKVKL